MAKSHRMSWIDEATQTPLIDDYARRLDGFVQTFADGRVDQAELQAQEERVTSLMKEIEPELDDSLHAKVTRLLCELTAYDILQVFHTVEQARPKTKFRG